LAHVTEEQAVPERAPNRRPKLVLQAPHFEVCSCILRFSLYSRATTGRQTSHNSRSGPCTLRRCSFKQSLQQGTPVCGHCALPQTARHRSRPKSLWQLLHDTAAPTLLDVCLVCAGVARCDCDCGEVGVLLLIPPGGAGPSIPTAGTLLVVRRLSSPAVHVQYQEGKAALTPLERADTRRASAQNKA
jgi:hypothetical protein